MFALAWSTVCRLYLYSKIWINMFLWIIKQAFCYLFRLSHPLGWSKEQDFKIVVLKTLFTSGTYVHWRNFMAVWQLFLGLQERAGLVLQRVPGKAFEVAGFRDSWWISLAPALLKDAPPPKASCVLMFMHGGAFVAGNPLMYCPAFRTWMRQLAAQGVRMRILSVGYPLAPENPYPAPVLGVAEAYCWLLKQLKTEGSDEAVILGGDSAGGNLVVSALAYLRDPQLMGQQHSPSSSSAAQPVPPPPAGAILISPAVDFTERSVFGPRLAAYFANLPANRLARWTGKQQEQQQQQCAADGQEAAASSQPPPGSEWDYVTVAEGSVLARHYVRATSEADMCMPLVCPTLLPSFKGLTQQQMLCVYGAIEVMAPDIAAFAKKLEQQGVALPAHAEPNEPHVYCVLPIKRVRDKGAQVLVPYIASCAIQAR